MNVLMVTPDFPNPNFPANMYVVEQARALQRQGHRVLLVHAEQQRRADRAVNLGEGSDSWFGLEVIRVKYPVIRGASYLPCIIGLLRAVHSMHTYFTPDLIHAQVTLPVGLAAVVAGRVYGMPVAITEHWGPIKELCRGRAAFRAMQFSLRHASSVITVSNHLKQELQTELGINRPIQVIPNLYDPTKFYLAPSEKVEPSSRDILFVGRGGDTRKGNDLMLKAFAEAFSRSTGPLRLLMIGPNLEKELSALAAELGVLAHCVFHGALAHDQLATQMQECAFLVVASRYETFGLVLIEAMACGKPVIATRCGGPEELVTSATGLLVPVNDVGKLADSIVKMGDEVSNYDANTISRYAYEHYSDHAIVQQIVGVYERLVVRRTSEFAPIF